MPDEKFPSFGDDDLRVKPTLVYDRGGINQGSRYDQRGALVPTGPKWPLELKAPDIEGLPWRRARGDEWTTERERTEIKAWLVRMLKDHPEWERWELDEKFTSPRSPQRTGDPYLIVRVYAYARDGVLSRLVAETSASFTREEVDSLVSFRSRLALVRSALEAHAAR